MATGTKKTEAMGKLAGKTVAFVGKFGYRDMFRSQFADQVMRAGGEVVDAAKTIPDYLVVGEGRGGKPPSEVAKLQAKSPTIEILETADFLQLLLPDREELLREIAKGRREDKDRYWDEFQHLCRQANAQVDLQKVDLKKADLYGAHLEAVVLTGSDLRGAKTQFTHFGDLENVKFDDCDGKSVYLQDLESCTFRRANLEKAWMFYGSGRKVTDCDFTSAKMSGARIERGVVSDCKFVGADLTDAKLENSSFDRSDFSKADMTRVHAAESKFNDSILAKANFTRADLRKASLVRADLRNAVLCEAVLSEADLSSANIDGADFQDAVLTGANLQGLDISRAKNLQAPVVKTPGPKLLELAAAAAGAKSFVTSAEVDLGQDEFARLELDATGNSIHAFSIYQRAGNHARDRIPALTFEDGMLKLADRWPKSTLRLDSIEAKGSKTLRGQKLQDLTVAAWAETFGVPVLAPEELKAQREEQQAAALRERDALMKQIRTKGAKVWNSMDFRLRDRIELRGVDLSGAKLDKLSMWSCDLKGANFAGSSLVEAEFWNGQLPNAVFAGANLQRTRLENSVLNGANLRDATLTGANLSHAKILGADFTGAILTDANFFEAQFDQATVFPSGFKPPDSMIWKGEGPRPGIKKVKAAKVGSLDFETFLEKLSSKTEAERIKKAGSMLKAERFQLFVEVKEDSLLGIVKSQSNKELVYSCRLASDGSFGCCTQNLRPCGGLRGALCKHLLVLVIGLAKAGQLDAATVDHWINLSKQQKPAIDEESMSATFLRYKGAEAGEVDWRPTETIPEDFYAM